MSSSLFTGFTTRAIPSSPTTVASSFSASSSLSFLDELPMSHLPSEASWIPVPEPVRFKLTVTPLFFSINAPLTALITFSIDVEPFIDSVPLSSSVADASLADVPAADESVPATLLVAVWEQPVAAATIAAPAISDINFLFMLFPFLRVIPLGVFQILHNVYVHFLSAVRFPSRLHFIL